jgi:uncharacterized protein YprB with RNaseH-like and TPR domain
VTQSLAELEAYLDIETTGLSPLHCQVTVVGIYLVQGAGGEVVQLVGNDVTDTNLLNALQGVTSLYTYNGSRFDLPFLKHHLGINLAETCPHRDLMYDCWENNLYGGLKRVERQLGIPRQLTEVDGYEAIRLWWRYVNDYDKAALRTLLEYNKEDVINLKTLKERLL